MNKLKQIFDEVQKKIQIQNNNELCPVTRNSPKEKILKTISGDSISVKDFKNEISQILIENHISNHDDRGNYLNFLSFIVDISDKNINYNTNIFESIEKSDAWRDAITLYFSGEKANQVDYKKLYSHSPKEIMIAEVCKEMGKYKLEVKNGSFVIEEFKIKKAVDDLDKRIKDIGSLYILERIFKELSLHYKTKLKRYVLPKRYSDFQNQPELHIPYNYIINLCLKQYSFKGKKKYQTDKFYKKIIKLSKNVAFVYNLQDFNKINLNMFRQHWSIRDVLHKNILYDNIFRFKQMNPDKLEGIL